MLFDSQAALYRINGDFVRFRLETDCRGMVLIGPTADTFPDMRDLHVAASMGEASAAITLHYAPCDIFAARLDFVGDYPDPHPGDA